MNHYDLLIRGATIITMDAERTIIENGCVGIIKNRIQFIGTREQAQHATATTSIDAAGKLLLPGFINGHTHAGMSFFRGVADDFTQEVWLKDHIFPLEKEFVSEEFVYWATLLSCYEMIQNGITTFVDMYFYEQSVARAVEESNMRAILGATVFKEDDSNNAQPFIEHYKNHPLITPTVAAHSPYICSPETLRASAACARRYNVPLIMHVAETQEEVDFIQQQHGTTPFIYLERLGITEQPFIAAHAVHLSAEDRACIVRNKIGIVYNATSNMKLASGIAPITTLLEEGALIGIGTDGCASNNNLDIIMEMKLGSLLQKVATKNAAALPATAMLELATIKGAQALGMENEIGSLEIDKKADMLLMHCNEMHQMPSYSVASQIVYASRSSDITTVIVDGRVVMHNREVNVMHNRHDVVKKMNEYAQKIAHFIKRESST